MIDARDYLDKESLSKAMKYEESQTKIKYLQSNKSKLELSFNLYSKYVSEQLEYIDRKIKYYQDILNELEQFIKKD